MEKNITLQQGETRSLELDNLGGAGYSWVVEKNSEKVTSVKIESGTTTEQLKKMPVGGTTKIKVVVTALAEGHSIIQLSQKRIWEDGVMPIKTVQIDVVVKK